MSEDVKNLRPKVGVGVAVFKDGKLLLGKRKGSHGAGQYAWPGGHLEFNESFEACAKRETMEEAGIEIGNIKFIRLLNFKAEGKHYVDIALSAEWQAGEPKIMEPEKCEGWGWYDINTLPVPLFGPIPYTLKSLKTGQIFFDA